MRKDAWPQHRIDYIIENYETKTDAEIAAKLGNGITRSAVTGMRNRLGYIKKETTNDRTTGRRKDAVKPFAGYLSDTPSRHSFERAGREELAGFAGGY